MLVNTTLDNDYNSYISIPGVRLLHQSGRLRVFGLQSLFQNLDLCQILLHGPCLLLVGLGQGGHGGCQLLDLVVKASILILFSLKFLKINSRLKRVQ